jgi:PKD repeat protein
MLMGLLGTILLAGCALFNQPPLASFTTTPITGPAPLVVQFAATATDPEGGALSYVWSFGDGASAATPTVTHTYTDAGPYTVELQVTDRWGAKATASQTIVVTTDSAEVTAEFTASMTSGAAPLAVDFNATTSSCAVGTIVAYQWSFGDGASDTGPVASHTYASVGTYVVTLAVFDEQGRSDSETLVITVTADGGGSCS